MTNRSDPALTQKEEKLELLLKVLDSVLLAFSGGVDSAYLLFKAVHVIGRDKVLAVTADSALYPPEEAEAARKLASALGVHHIVIKTGELSREEFCSNSPQRCYYCKSELFSELGKLAREHNLSYVLDGSNADDTGDYRPGSRAARECGVRSPLQEAGLTKAEIRLLSRSHSLATWDKPAAACLASRFPYGERLEISKLKQVEQGERFLRKLGLKREVRVRRHGTIARIEIDNSELTLFLHNRQMIVDYLKQLGFIYITLDLEGFQTGSMNRVLEDLSGGETSAKQQ